MEDGLSPTPEMELVQEIMGRVNRFIEDDDSGIPEIKKQLEQLGFPRPDISVAVTLTHDNLAEVKRELGIGSPVTNGTMITDADAEMRSARELGIEMTADDLTEMNAARIQSDENTKRLMIAKLRQIATPLANRCRNYVCGFTKSHYPDFPVTFEEPSMETMFPYADNKKWQAKIEEIIKQALLLPNAFDILGSVLTAAMQVRQLEDII